MSAFNFIAEPIGNIETNAIVNSAFAARSEAEVEVLIDEPDRIELHIPCELKAISSVEKVLDLSQSNIPQTARDEITFAFRELLSNAIEHGCQMDEWKRVEVSCVRLKHAIICGIKDPGEGFNPAQLDHAAINNPDDDPVRHARVRDE